MRKIPSKAVSFVDISSAMLFKFYRICTSHDLMHVSEGLPSKRVSQTKSHRLRGYIFHSIEFSFG